MTGFNDIPMQAPANFLDEFMKTHNAMQAVGQAPLQNQLLQAQVKRENALSNLPFGGKILPGVAGQIAGLETIKQAYGEDSPQYQTAKQQFDLQNQNTMSRIGYQNGLARTLNQRYTTTPGKEMIEQLRVKHGLSPSGASWGTAVLPPEEQPVPRQPLPITYGQTQKLKQLFEPGDEQNPPGDEQNPPGNAQNQSNSQDQLPNQNESNYPGAPTPQQGEDTYGAILQKSTGDAVTRRQAGNSLRILDAASKIDIKPLEEYTGAHGMAASTYNKYKMLTGIGEVDPEYRKYEAWAQYNKKQMADAMRQALNTSLVPEYVKLMVNPLIDPTNSGWNDPQQVRLVWKTFTDSLHDYAKSLVSQTESGVPTDILDSDSFEDYKKMKNKNKKSASSADNDPLGIR